MTNKYVTVAIGVSVKTRKDFFQLFLFRVFVSHFVGALCDFAIVLDRKGWVAFRSVIPLE